MQRTADQQGLITSLSSAGTSIAAIKNAAHADAAMGLIHGLIDVISQNTGPRGHSRQDAFLPAGYDMVPVMRLLMKMSTKEGIGQMYNGTDGTEKVMHKAQEVLAGITTWIIDFDFREEKDTLRRLFEFYSHEQNCIVSDVTRKHLIKFMKATYQGNTLRESKEDRGSRFGYPFPESELEEFKKLTIRPLVFLDQFSFLLIEDEFDAIPVLEELTSSDHQYPEDRWRVRSVKPEDSQREAENALIILRAKKVRR